MIRRLILAVCGVIFANATQAAEMPSCTKLFETLVEAESSHQRELAKLNYVVKFLGGKKQGKLYEEVKNSENTSRRHYEKAKLRFQCMECGSSIPPKEKCVSTIGVIRNENLCDGHLSKVIELEKMKNVYFQRAREALNAGVLTASERWRNLAVQAGKSLLVSMNKAACLSGCAKDWKCERK